MTATTVMGIKLKNPQTVYHPGQHIIGTATLKLSGNNEALDLIVRFLGKSMCRYLYKPKGKRPTICYENEHITLEHAKIMSSPAAGKHDIDFQFRIPKNIPGSVDLEFGSISYQLVAGYGDNIVSRAVTVFVTDRLENKTVQTPISDCNVSSARRDTKEGNNSLKFSELCCEMDIVSNTMAAEDRDNENERKQENKELDSSALRCETEIVVSSCFSFIRGSVGAKLSSKKNSYRPGEVIVVRVDAYNNVNINTERLKLSLVQTINYITQKNTKTVITNIADVTGPQIQRNGGSDQWESEPLGIPLVAAATTRDDVISVEYGVRLKVSVRFCPALELFLPVVINSLDNLNEIGGRRGRQKQSQAVEVQF